jgi:6-phosphogluconolactonase
MPPHITTVPRAVDLYQPMASKIRDIVDKALAERGRAVIALSGGSTPAGFYQFLAGHSMDWTNVHFFWSDERCVVATHPDSNYGMAHSTLLSKIAVSPGNVHRVSGEEDPLLSAQQYEDEIRDLFDMPEPAVPSFDLILLGLGDDGHTASLFPETDALEETGRLVADNFVKKLKAHRVTFTLPLINAARNIVFLVAGASKAHAVAGVLKAADPQFPASGVRSEGNVYWFLDKEAASQL